MVSGVGGFVGKVAGGLTSAAAAAAATGGGGGAAGGSGVATSRQSEADALARHRAELHRAVALLHRTVGVMTADASHALGVAAPPGWGQGLRLVQISAQLEPFHTP